MFSGSHISHQHKKKSQLHVLFIGKVTDIQIHTVASCFFYFRRGHIVGDPVSLRYFVSSIRLFIRDIRRIDREVAVGHFRFVPFPEFFGILNHLPDFLMGHGGFHIRQIVIPFLDDCFGKPRLRHIGDQGAAPVLSDSGCQTAEYFLVTICLYIL